MAEGDDGGGGAKRQRASSGYAEKMAGYALKDTHLGAAGGADAAGAPQVRVGCALHAGLLLCMVRTPLSFLRGRERALHIGVWCRGAR